MNSFDYEKKLSYIENVKPGTLIAFRTLDGKAKSGKVLKRSSNNKMLQVITEYDEEHIVKFEDVLWVKTNTRWPKGVYNLLKGIKNEQ